MDHTIEQYKHSGLTDAIICCFYTVYNALGYGFLEKVYENALMLGLARHHIPAVNQSPINVHYLGTVVGEYFADILVQDQVIVEIKATSHLAIEHDAQLLNYLKVTRIEVGLLLNFGPKPEVRRKAFDNLNKMLVASKGLGR